MKIVCLLGSPRPGGNSATVAKKFIGTAESLGAEVQTFALNKLEYKGCQGCYVCKTKKESCVLDDGLTPVLEAVKDCDVLVIASAIYYGDVTSQTKAFIDRTFSYIKPDYLTNPQPSRLAPGKKVLWITSQEDSNPNRYDAVDNYSRFFGYFGMESSSIKAAGVGEYGQVNVGEAYLNLAKEAAQRLVD